MSTSRRGSALAAVFAALLTAALGLVLAPASPAQAAYACGSEQTVRVSIIYRACAQPGVNPLPDIRGQGRIQNNHGSSVVLVYQHVKKVEGVTTYGSRIRTTFQAGRTDVYISIPCDIRDRLQYGLRVSKTENIDGPWGPVVWSPVFTCD